MSRLLRLLCIAILVAIATSCSGKGSPLVPPGAGGEMSLTGAASVVPEGSTDHALWGFWEGYFDPSTGALEISLLREAAFHMNVGRILEQSGAGLSVNVNSFNPTEALLDMDVTITHPVPDSDLRCFDVRGIFMGPGDTIVSQTDPGLIYNTLTGTRLLNADGYTRWWNAVEFTTPGLFGYDSNLIDPGFLVPTTTLNPYKYFSDPLGPTDPVVPNVNQSNRGTFSTDTNPPSVTRNYQIRFPVIGGSPKIGFHYAIDASWAPPSGDSPTPMPIGAFPLLANCPEAFHIQVNTDNSTVWYEAPDKLGGDLVLDIEVFDWGAGANPEGIMGEVSGISIESPTLCDPYYLNLTTALPGTQPTSGIFHVTIPDVHPTGVDNQEILVTVKSKSPVSYAPPSGGQDYPTSAALAAYAIVNIPVLVFKPSFLSINLISPNGGEVWPISSEQMVEWSWTDEIPNVDIYLSTDGGANYDVPIATGIANTGQFMVDSVLNSPTDHARIRVSSTSAPEISGESAGDFVIKPTITVDLPNGGDFLLAGTSTVIKWTASETIQNVGILLSMDSGETYLEALSLSSPNTGEFVWEYIADEYVSNKCRIEVFDVDHPQVLDGSDSDFTILPISDALITVLSPNGSEEFEAGKPAEITWGASGAIANVAIRLSIDSGLNYDIELTPSTPNDGNFTIGAIPDDAVGNACRIRISDVDDSTVYDSSDNDFMIAPSITVLSPNGSELWIEGNVYQITWEASSVIQNVAILKSSDSGQQYLTPITLSTDNDGSYTWYVEPSGDTGSHQRIQILDANNTSIHDESDFDFTIFPEQEAPVNVLSPNGGETWIAGTSREITWTAVPSVLDVKIELSIDGGTTWPYFITDSTSNTSSFIWDSVPSLAVGNFNRIRISDVLNPSVNDISNASFTVEEMGDSFMDILNPINWQTWQIGCSQTVQWQWGGLISQADISFKLDNLGTYSTIADNVANNGAFVIPTFEPAYINDLSLWDSPMLTGVVRIESSDDPAIFDEVNVVIPINLGILYDMVQAADPTDSDGDNLPDEIETFLGTDPYNKDSDLAGPDAFFDSFEIFGNGYFNSYDLIPDGDNDGLIAPLDSDDDGDGINDGQTTDSDGDGVPNYLEYYGFTYDWMSGTYHLWDGHSINNPYFKTDPLQPSTDQDPYSDSMEASGAFMDVSVHEPGDYPMVPAYPDIIVRLEGYDVAVNEEITLEEGNSLEQGTEWSTQTQKQSSFSFQHGWELSAGAEFGYDDGIVGKVSVGAKYGQTYNTTNTDSVTKSIGGSAATSQEWSQATCTNPTDAAHIKIYLKVYNQGTSCASNIIPTITLKIGNRNVATFDTGTSINILEPGGIYPSQPSTYWVIDNVNSNPIILTLDELRALECGAPVSIVMTQMSADVMLMNESGQWESAGDWGEYMARCEAVCSNLYLEIGGGNFLHYLVYSGDEPSAPEVIFGDALAWAAGAGISPTETWITYTDDSGQQQTASLEDWSFAFDAQTLIDNGFTGSPLQPPAEDYNIKNMVLSPYTQILGTIPREQIPDVQGPEIIYAYLDEVLDVVKALAFDYSGIEELVFIDKNGTEYPMNEVIAGSGFFTLDISSAYEMAGNEKVRAYSVDTSIPYTEGPVEKTYYPVEPVPQGPDIYNVDLYLMDRMLKVYITYDPINPLISVTVHHPTLPYNGVEMVPAPIYWQEPNCYFYIIPDNITDNNKTQYVIVAEADDGQYDLHYVTEGDCIINYIGPIVGTQLQALWDYTGDDYWRVDSRNLDYTNPASGFTWYSPGNGDVWNDAWDSDIINNGYGFAEVWVRAYDEDDDNKELYNDEAFLMHFNYPWAMYSGSKQFEYITKYDCMAQSLNPPGYLPIWNIHGTDLINPPKTFIMQTSEGRWCKFTLNYLYYDWAGWPDEWFDLRWQLTWVTWY
ncbi:MAG: hypothetical protein NTY09_10160 [bacterium]|nr:hypothetical protein [bacterium]